MSVGGGELQLLLCCCIGVVLSGVLGGVIYLVVRKQRVAPGTGLAAIAPTPMPAALNPVATDTLFFIRFADSHAGWITSQVGNLAPDGRLRGPQAIRDAAMELIRSVPDATHAWVGAAEGPTISSPRSPERGGAIVALRVHTGSSLSTVADDTNATAIANTLKALSSLPDMRLSGGSLAVVPEGSDPSFPMLVPLSAATLPGQRQCPACSKPYPQYETFCPHCGANAPT